MSNENANTNVVSGTIKELIARDTTCNGVVLDQAMFSVLTRLGIATAVRKISSGKQGKPSTVWEFPSTVACNFAANEAALEVIAEDTSAINVNETTLEVVNEPVQETAQETVIVDPQAEDAIAKAETVEESIQPELVAKPTSRSKRNRGNKAEVVQEADAEVQSETASNVVDEMDVALTA